MSIPLKSAWSHSRLDRKRGHKDIPQPENVARKTHDKNIQDSHRRPKERGASPTATSHSRTNRSSSLKNIPEPKSASRGAHNTNTQHEYGSPSETGASPSTIAPSVLANVEINLLSSAPRPHPAYRSLRKERIRLLRILPASSSAEIRCQLDDFSLRRPPAYTALSYTWGSQHGIHEIYVNDRPLLVPKNLFRFLNCARDLGGDLSGWIWCDMLSINQVDLAERGYQVTLMSRIFHTAQVVVVWLGPIGVVTWRCQRSLEFQAARDSRSKPFTYGRVTPVMRWTTFAGEITGEGCGYSKSCGLPDEYASCVEARLPRGINSRP
jgi:hypothetical protein